MIQNTSDNQYYKNKLQLSLTKSKNLSSTFQKSNSGNMTTRNVFNNYSLIISPRKHNKPFVSNIMNRSFSNINQQKKLLLGM